MESPGATSEEATIRCIEAGMVPDGVLALYPLDPIRRGRRIVAFCGAIFAAAIVADWALQAYGPVLFGLAMCLALAGVRLTPAVDVDEEVDDELASRRKPAVVVTATAILKREARGFRTWMFAELVCAQLSLRAERRDMVLVGRDGTRTLIDCGALQSGGLLIEEVAMNLPIEMV
jgi:hypothetical protein